MKKWLENIFTKPLLTRFTKRLQPYNEKNAWRGWIGIIIIYLLIFMSVGFLCE